MRLPSSCSFIPPDKTGCGGGGPQLTQKNWGLAADVSLAVALEYSGNEEMANVPESVFIAAMFLRSARQRPA
jgi:hypothetical protein